jgi:hypothetical protein
MTMQKCRRVYAFDGRNNEKGEEREEDVAPQTSQKG